ncbi:hypothetical protein P4S91_21735, partial [Aneurinibacillus aneurinilyticus]|uniref:hypothetical protein n=1 Tax=Aneurinibacillus aneurinilyticus TaxID=1391 RepID=UPI002E220F0C|nr:hypothetical protein [Aneurinibacillus aneurinilyticus]
FSIHLWISRVLIVQRGKGHHNGTQTRPFVSLSERLPGQAKKDSNCLPLRTYPDVLRSRLAGAKSGLLSLGAGDEPTPVWGTVW